VWNKTCTQLSLSQILFQNPTVLEIFRDSPLILDEIRRSFLTKPATAAMFTSVQGDLGRLSLSLSLSRHLLPVSFRLEIENTT